MTKDTPIIRSLRVQSNQTPSGATQLLDDKEDSLPDDISLDGDDISDPNYEPNMKTRKKSSVPRKEGWILGKPTIIYNISYPKHINILKKNQGNDV